MFRWLARRRPLSPDEREALAAFGEMSINDVRRRGAEFRAAEEEYLAWLETRRANRAHPPEGDELAGYAREVQNGVPSEQWRALEGRLRARGAWQVRELGEEEAIAWARRLSALSAVHSRPERRPVGSPRPEAQVRRLDGR